MRESKFARWVTTIARESQYTIRVAVRLCFEVTSAAGALFLLAQVWKQMFS